MLLKWLLVLVLIAHGIGHITGVSAFWTTLPMGFNQNPWIFGAGGTISSLVGRIFGVIWLTATVIFIAAGVGLLTNQAWWTNAAIIGAVVSLVAIVPWWNTVTLGVKMGALLDVAILAGLLPPLKAWVFQVFKL